MSEAFTGADVFFGLSGPGTVEAKDLAKMNKDAIVFAMANPTPEIMPEEVGKNVRIMATGRSDYPNQINNVLCFPGIFRGALDCQATDINEEMKLAATRALAKLVKEDVPESVSRIYGVARLKFGLDYLIPKPFDPRVLVWESSAVAQAAMDTGVAREPVNIRNIAKGSPLSPSRWQMRRRLS